MIREPLIEIKKERQKKRQEERFRKKILKIRKKIEVFLRTQEMNSFARVYYLQAIDKIIEEIALKHYIGEPEIRLENRKIILEIVNKNLTKTDIKNLIEQDKKNQGIYTLLTALTMVDDFEIKTNEDGGVKVIITKDIPLVY